MFKSKGDYSSGDSGGGGGSNSDGSSSLLSARDRLNQHGLFGTAASGDGAVYGATGGSGGSNNLFSDDVPRARPVKSEDTKNNVMLLLFFL